MDFTQTAKLIPVKDWEWTLYRIRWMDHEGGRVIKTKLLVTAHDPFHEVEERSPSNCEWIECEVVQEKVPAPRAVGRICMGDYDVPIYESGWEAAARYEDRL